jgi:Phage terminase, small subunit
LLPAGTAWPPFLGVVLMTAKKPAAQRQRGARTKDVGAVVALVPAQQSPMVAGADLAWRDEVRESWAELWSSPLAGQFRPTDVPALKRLFAYRSQLAEAQDRYAEEPTALGSMGQPVLSPWAAEVHRLEATVQKLEDRFGLTPMSRLRLGVTYEEGVSLASRNSQLLEAFRAAKES